MKQAFLVYGAESSGTRFVTSAFIAAGCDGDAGHRQRFDSGFDGAGDPIVWRRSFPHAKGWPDVRAMVARLHDAGYLRVSVIVTVRDHFAMTQSQVARGHVDTRQQAERQIHEAYDRIFHVTRRLGLPVHLAVYESLVHCEGAVERLLGSCGLRLRTPLDIRDENAKHFLGGVAT